MSISHVGCWDHARTTPRQCWRGLYMPWYTVTYVPYRVNGMPSHIPQNFVFYSIIEYTVCNFLMRIEARIEKARVAVLKRREDAGIVTATPVATAPGRAEFRCSGAGTSSPPGSRARDTRSGGEACNSRNRVPWREPRHTLRLPVSSPGRFASVRLPSPCSRHRTPVAAVHVPVPSEL